MINSKNIILQVLQALISIAITVFVFGYIDDLNTDNYIISAKWLLRGIALSLIILLFLMTLYITNKINIKNKLKKYTENQIKMAKDILNNKIQNINDFLDYFQACPQYKPFNSNDKNTNLLILDDEKGVDKLLKEFKDIMNDIIKYEYIEIEIDNNIEIFTYLKYHDNSKKEAVRFLDMEMIFNNKFKQNRFIVKNPKRLKKLIRLKALPEQDKNKG